MTLHRDPTADWILGLDIGSNSIGWMLVREHPIPGSVNAIGGVRVFPAATANEKDIEASKTAIRRTARGMRRQHQRKSRRKRRLLHVLRSAGILPADTTQRLALLNLDPYALRAEGLDRPLPPEQFGRALMHLNQRRGFKSNRRTDRTADDTGKVKADIARLRQEISASGCRTVGEYLYKHVPALTERRRGRYLHREMIREEFNLLWEKQSAGREAIFTPELRAKVEDAIFYQRPFDQGDHKVGQCEFEPSEKRCRIGHRQFQRFRILQEIANLRIIEPGKDERALTVNERQILAAELDRKKEVKFEQLRKLLGFDEKTHINLTRGKRERLDGNQAEVALRKVFGKAWDTFPEDKRDEINEAALELPDDQLVARARDEWGLNDAQIEELLKAPLNDKHGRVSLKAIRKILPFLEQLEPGQTLYHAVEQAGYGDRQQLSDAYDKLPYPPGVRFNEKVEQELIKQRLFVPNQTEITNPVVRKALFEVRKVVNAIIARYGKPSEIRVELARETKGSIQERNEATKENAKKRKEREQIRELLISRGIANPSGTDILKYRLWQECNETCPYSGRPISFEQLFISPEVQIEHILPYSQTLDDSFANKTLCFDDVNREKGGRSPYEAFHHQEERYTHMLERVARFQGPFRYKKLARFKRKELNLDGCVQRQLNDTRFINRQVVAYLKLLGVPVRCSRGQVTAELRHCWGLNTILSPDGSNEKNRADHRHHAIDAAVIAMTTDANIHNLARREQFRKDREAFPEPWPGFRAEIKAAVERINVSHRPTRKVRGALHEETNYGPAGKPDTFVYRKPLAELTVPMVANIRDATIRRLVEERLRQHGINPSDPNTPRNIPKAVFAEPILLPNGNGGPPVPVKKVRIETREQGLIPFRDSQGKPYRYAKPGNNHHVEFFEWEENGRTVRDAIAVTLFEAAQRVANKQPVVSKTHPTNPGARFMFALSKNDMVLLTGEDGVERLYRVQTMSISGGRPDLRFRLHTASGLEDKNTLVRILSLKPESFRCRKVLVSPIGEIQMAGE